MADPNGTMYNGTNVGGGSLPSYAKAILVVMYSGIIVLAIGGNTIVCYIVLGYKPMRTVTNYFIVNLAISDILMACLCIPFTFTANMLYSYWPFGPAMCPIVFYFQATSVFLSTFTLVSISLDRYIAIIYPLRPKMTTRQAMLVIGTIWVFSCSVSLPIAVVSEIEYRPVGLEAYPYCAEMWSHRGQQLVYGIVIMLLQYFIPLFILIFTYFRIGFIIWVKKTPGEACSDRDQRMAASKRKMVKMMITVVLIYAICWLPLHSMNLALELDRDLYVTKPYMAVVWIISQWLAMSNSCYNPLVYCWMNATYRRGFRYALRWCPCVKYPDHEKKREEMSRSNTLVTTVRGNVSPGEGLRKHPARYMAPGEECVPLNDRNGRNGVTPKVTVTRPDLSDDDM